MRGQGLLWLAAGVAFASASACKNTLQFGTQGTHPCNFPGTVCSVGDPGVGDGGPALSASLISPQGIAVDADGNVYIADTGENRIRKIDAQGNVTTIAGNGRATADFVPGLPGPETTVAYPLSVDVAPDGAVFWNTDRDCGIYRLDPVTQTVTMVAGGYGCGYQGGAGDALGSRFGFEGCAKIHLDGTGNLIVADPRNYRIRYVNLSTSQVTVFGVTIAPLDQAPIAGNGNYTPSDGVAATAQGLDHPCDAVEDGSGNLLIAARYNNLVRIVDPSGIIDTIAGYGGSGTAGDGGPAIGAQMQEPMSLGVDANGLIFVADRSNRVRVINEGGQPASWGTVTIATAGIMTVAGGGSTGFVLDSNGTAALTQQFSFGTPPQIAFDATGNLFVPDPGVNVVRKVDAASGTMSIIAGLASSGAVDSFALDPSGVVRAPDGSFYMTARIPYLLRVAPDGTTTVVAGNGTFDPAGDGGPATETGFWGSGLAMDADGALFYADPANHLVRRIDPSGVVTTIAGDGGGSTGGDGGPAVNASFTGPWGVLLDPDGNLYVSEEDDIRYINLGVASATVAGVTIAPGNIETIAGGNGNGFAGDGGLATDAKLDLQYYYYTDLPGGMALDGRTLYVAESQANRIRKIDLDTGIIDTAIGNGIDSPDGVGEPVGIAVVGGSLYWTQGNGSYVKRMTLPHGPVEIVAGDGQFGYFGDGYSGAEAELAGPEGLAVAPNGVLYVADGSHRLRRIQP